MKKYPVLLGALLTSALISQAPQAQAFGIGNLTAAIPSASRSMFCKAVTFTASVEAGNPSVVKWCSRIACPKTVPAALCR